MASLKARVAYLQGLTVGLEMPADSKETKLLTGIVDIMTEFADVVEDLKVSQDRLEDYLESIDEDLYGLERDIYPDEDDINGDYNLDMDDTDYLNGITVVNCPHCDSEIRVAEDNGHGTGHGTGHDEAH